MKILYLLRHAKSDWDDTGLPDQERPLASRGVRASHDMAKRLKKAGITPSLVLCSPALRARQTLELVAPALGKKVDVRYEEGLYGASVADVIKRLGKLPASVPSVMVVGHNPTMQELALDLSGSGAEIGRMRQKFPTAALAILEIDRKTWKDLDRGCARLGELLTPRER